MHSLFTRFIINTRSIKYHFFYSKNQTN